ncbi:MAG: proline--tRNA ligase [Candidatus Krumholzibacteria bacterium]|nr:proline--tRNA ligase [Candidatus Krumholzibacteria bacterium]
MRWSKYYLPTYKEVPSEAEIPSHQLMLRAGMIRKLSAGVYTFLPAGMRVLAKVEAIVREEMDRAGGQEVLMPVLHPGELYEETGRLDNFGALLFKLRDRRERFFALGPTHEEVVTDIARAELKSYRQLPQCLYQINVKFRDEFRPRFGLMRAREFIMKDAYSFHASAESLHETYEAMAEAYRRILARCGLESVMVEAESGAIGGDINHEFVVLAEAGESEIFRCPSCGYAANDERAESLGRAREKEPATASPQRVDTPGKTTIEDVTAFLGVDATRLVKTLLYRAGDGVVAALVPGERQLNEVKLSRALGGAEVAPLSGEEVAALTRADVGYAGPVGLPDTVRIVADTLLEQYDGMIVGANQSDAHLRGVKMGRDYKAHEVAGISAVAGGDTCKACGKGALVVRRGVELGHIFKLDRKYSQSMNATYLDRDGAEKHFIMGCYGFGVSRAVAAAIEQHHDENGIRWPRAITPFHAIILPVDLSNARVVDTAESIYAALREAGLDVLLDDRELRPGPKFKDADLVGVPIRLTLGERNLKNGNVEVTHRLEDRADLVPVGDAVEVVRRYYAEGG